MARKVYTREFRETAVRLASQPDVSVEKVANELGITGWTLRRWMKLDLPVPAPTSQSQVPKETDLQQRIRQLEAENKQLRMERDILKKATAFFANQQP
ncbi:MAG: transposase [Phycisphaeraceae bacterium]|nr:transposase [Phycisphaeraceae bacterium]MBX3390528.1 transposase [Phycisphaeraceae bacterium]